ncbi:MAG TPA: hypothetical protein VHG28_06480 [Longimicrobiaceae bacterium]|nr:hypothetical protein [Longimicrobiaceae bacterium]
MSDLREAKELLDEINRAISNYDPVLKERARDILLERAFRTAASDSAPASVGRGRGRPRRGADEDGADAPDLASLLERWSPTTMSDKALLGAYYLARIRGDDTVTSQAINSELKRNGLAISNITRAIEANMRPDRPLMTQEKKMGSTKQARKQYRITQAGIDAVERKLQI